MAEEAIEREGGGGVMGQLRLGFMCGLYEPSRSGEQEGHGQLGNRIGQNVRGVADTDSSEGETHTGHNEHTHKAKLFFFLNRQISITFSSVRPA